MGTKARLVIFLLLVAAAIYVGWNMIPPYFHKSQFQDDLDDIVRRASYTAVSEDDLKKMVISKAQDEDIVLKEDQIAVARTGLGLTISVHYRVHVDMTVYQTDLDFTANTHNKLIGS